MANAEVGFSKLLRTIYNANILVIGILLILAVLKGLIERDELGNTVILYVILAQVFLITPLLIPFLLLNIWRAVKYKLNRLRYLIISILLVPIIIWGIDAMINMPMP